MKSDATDAETTATASPTCSIIGIGNTVRRDDGLGPFVIERLLRSELPATVEIRAAHQLTPELAEQLSGRDLFVLIDAHASLPSGEISWQRVGPAADYSGASAHQLTVEALLVLCRHLYGQCPETVLVSVGAEDLTVGEGLSATVEKAAAEVVARVLELVSK